MFGVWGSGEACFVIAGPPASRNSKRRQQCTLNYFFVSFPFSAISPPRTIPDFSRSSSGGFAPRSKYNRQRLPGEISRGVPRARARDWGRGRQSDPEGICSLDSPCTAFTEAKGKARRWSVGRRAARKERDVPERTTRIASRRGPSRSR